MKKIYLLASMACVSLLTQAQIHSTNFAASVADTLITTTEFPVSQSGSNLIIQSFGHGEWSGVKYVFNDGENASTFAMSKEDTVFVRVRADYEGDVKPKLSFGLADENGVGPNNELYNGGNAATLSNEWQVFKFTVKNWNMEWGDANDPNLGSDMDSTKVASINFAPNAAFATFPSTNGEGDDINAPFVGKIYIDYISVGSSITEGIWLDKVSTYDLSFDNDESDNITASPSFMVSAQGEGDLTITSAGYDEWDYVRYTMSDNVVDLTNNSMLEFTASVVPADGYTGEVGVMVVAIDEMGNSLNAAGAYVYQSLSSTSETIQVTFTSFKDAEGNPVDSSRIAYLDILINPGFSSNPQTNDLGKSLITSFEGVVTIESIKLGEAVEPNGLLNSKVESLSFYPNPAVASINVGQELEGAAYSIISLTGAEVKSGVLNATQLSVSDLEEGMYIIQATLGSNTYTNTFVKQ